MKSFFNRLRSGTVFRSTDNLSGPQTWIMWFHRVSVLKYAFFFTWGLSSIVETLPSLRQFAGGDLWLPLFFAIGVVVTTSIAGTAAAIWPARKIPNIIAQVELHAAMLFVTLVIFYFIVQLITGVARFSSLSLILSYAAIPALRAAIIYTGTTNPLFNIVPKIRNLVNRLRKRLGR